MVVVKTFAVSVAHTLSTHPILSFAFHVVVERVEEGDVYKRPPRRLVTEVVSEPPAEVTPPRMEVTLVRGMTPPTRPVTVWTRLPMSRSLATVPRRPERTEVSWPTSVVISSAMEC